MDEVVSETKLSYKRTMVATEFEIKGLSLSEFIKDELLSKFNDKLGPITIISIGFMADKYDDIVMFWHKSSEDKENKIVTVNVKEDEIKNAIKEVLVLIDD